MTPFRSCIVILNTALAVAILGELQLKGGVTTYAVVSRNLYHLCCSHEHISMPHTASVRNSHHQQPACTRLLARSMSAFNSYTHLGAVHVRVSSSECSHNVLCCSPWVLHKVFESASAVQFQCLPDCVSRAEPQPQPVQHAVLQPVNCLVSHHVGVAPY